MSGILEPVSKITNDVLYSWFEMFFSENIVVEEISTKVVIQWEYKIKSK